MSSVHLLIQTEGNREILHLSGSHVSMASSLAQVVCCPRNEKSNSEIITLFNVLDLRGAWSSLHGLERWVLTPG